MKVLLIMIVCIQDPFLELSKSCITVPMEEQFESDIPSDQMDSASDQQ